MKKYPTKKVDNEITKADRYDVEIIEPSFNQNSFFSFRYSYKSISSFGGKTYIKSKEQRFENGKFETEEFEGTTDGNVYNNMFSEMQNYFSNQVSAFLKPLSSFFLPFSTKDKDR